MSKEMTTPSHGSVAQAAERIIRAATMSELRSLTVSALAELTHSPLVAWNEVCPRTGAIDAVMTPELDPRRSAELGEVFAATVAEHPVIAHYRSTGDGTPHAISDFLTARAFRRTAIYQEFYRELGAADQISFIVPVPDTIVGLAINSERPSVSAEDRLVCALLRPVIVQTYRLLNARSAAKAHIRTTLTAAGLSPREEQVMALVLDGAPTKMIAHNLRISPRTVDKHIERGLAKLGTRTRLQAQSLVWRQAEHELALRPGRQGRQSEASTDCACSSSEDDSPAPT